MVYEKVLFSVARIEKKLKRIENQLKDLPDGKIFCTRNGKNYKWYHSIGSKQTYIPKKKRSFAEQLAQKKYLLSLKKDLLREKCALEFYLRHHVQRPWESDQFLVSKPEYQELLSPFFKPESQIYHEWANSSYIQNPNYPNQLIYKISSNQYVRSKSEALIAMVLLKYNIPFRYECILQLGESVFYPDFTIRHPHTGEVYYLEHLGMMDNPAYIYKSFDKLKIYASHGIIPTINLITTYETKEHPLDIEQVERLVEEYFL